MATNIQKTPGSPVPAPAPASVLPAEDNKKYLREANVSVANSRSGEYKPAKTSGVEVRGTGAATKGVMARGPMA